MLSEDKIRKIISDYWSNDRLTSSTLSVGRVNKPLKVYISDDLVWWNNSTAILNKPRGLLRKLKTNITMNQHPPSRCNMPDKKHMYRIMKELSANTW